MSLNESLCNRKGRIFKMQVKHFIMKCNSTQHSGRLLLAIVALRLLHTHTWIATTIPRYCSNRCKRLSPDRYTTHSKGWKKILYRRGEKIYVDKWEWTGLCWPRPSSSLPDFKIRHNSYGSILLTWPRRRKFLPFRVFFTLFLLFAIQPRTRLRRGRDFAAVLQFVRWTLSSPLSDRFNVESKAVRLGFFFEGQAKGFLPLLLLHTLAKPQGEDSHQKIEEEEATRTGISCVPFAFPDENKVISYRHNLGFPCRQFLTPVLSVVFFSHDGHSSNRRLWRL